MYKFFILLITFKNADISGNSLSMIYCNSFLAVTSEDDCCNKRNFKLNIFENLQHTLFYNLFTAVCVMFLVKLRWPTEEKYLFLMFVYFEKLLG